MGLFRRARLKTLLCHGNHFALCMAFWISSGLLAGIEMHRNGVTFHEVMRLILP